MFFTSPFKQGLIQIVKRKFICCVEKNQSLITRFLLLICFLIFPHKTDILVLADFFSNLVFKVCCTCSSCYVFIEYTVRYGIGDIVKLVIAGNCSLCQLRLKFYYKLIRTCY